MNGIVDLQLSPRCVCLTSVMFHGHCGFQLGGPFSFNFRLGSLRRLGGSWSGRGPSGATDVPRVHKLRWAGSFGMRLFDKAEGFDRQRWGVKVNLDDEHG